MKGRNLTRFCEWLGIYPNKCEILLLKVVSLSFGSFKNYNLIITVLQPFINFCIYLWIGTDVRLIAYWLFPFSICLEQSLVWLLRIQTYFWLRFTVHATEQIWAVGAILNGCAKKPALCWVFFTTSALHYVNNYLQYHWFAMPNNSSGTGNKKKEEKPKPINKPAPLVISQCNVWCFHCWQN